MRITTGIFKAYDVRGLYPGEINEEVARLIGRGFVVYLGAAVCTAVSVLSPVTSRTKIRASPASIRQRRRVSMRLPVTAG